MHIASLVKIYISFQTTCVSWTHATATVMADFKAILIPFVLELLQFSIGQHVPYTTMGYGNNRYGVKTAYFWSYPERANVKNELMKIALEGRSCHAVHVNVVARHGARYTGLAEMRSFSDLQQKLKNNFTNRKYDFIDNWVNNYPEEKAELLTTLGKRESAYLGKYFGTELFDLLDGTVSPDGNPLSVHFTATRKIRTQNGAKLFFSGLTEAIMGRNLTNVTPEIRDNILRFYDNCKRYEQETADLSEQVKFESGPVFQKLVTDISKRIGATVPLTVGDVRRLYMLCATELAIMNNADWCTLLTDADREVLEYDNDIEEYITRLYGHPVTGQMSCPLGNDIFTAMDTAITANDRGSSYRKGVFQVGHADTVIDLATGLGLFNSTDYPRADNYNTMKNRTYRTSTHDTFSTHLAFILYNCGGAGADNYALKLFFNGKPLTIPKCNSDVCWYKNVRLGYKQFIDNCVWNSVCALDHSSSIVG